MQRPIRSSRGNSSEKLDAGNSVRSRDETASAPGVLAAAFGPREGRACDSKRAEVQFLFVNAPLDPTSLRVDVVAAKDLLVAVMVRSSFDAPPPPDLFVDEPDRAVPDRVPDPVPDRCPVDALPEDR